MTENREKFIMVNDKEYVNLDVGRYLYTCHIDNLRKIEGSFLERLVAAEHDTRKTGCDYLKIERDGRLFGSILGYLQNAKSSSYLRGLSRRDLRELQNEADFYGLEGLIQICEDALYTSTGESATLEMIFGLDAMRSILKDIDEPTLILNMDKFLELDFFNSIDDVVTICSLNRLSVYGYKAKENDHNVECELKLNSLLTLVDQELQIKHQLDVARFTNNDEFLRKVLKFVIAIMSLTDEDYK